MRDRTGPSEELRATGVTGGDGLNLPGEVRALLKGIEDVLAWGKRKEWPAVSYRAALEELIRRTKEAAPRV